MTLQEKIGVRIRALRQLRYPAFSIHRLAVQAEIDPGQLSRAERGLAGLSIDALERIATALNVSPGALVDPERKVSRMDVNEPDIERPCDEYQRLVCDLVRLVRGRLPEKELKRCSDTEQALIRHYIRSSIEEGAKRGHVLAEREIEAIREVQKKIEERADT